jgi:hypothetical protein
MTRTHLYVAVICLGAGLFAGVGLRRDSRNQSLEEASGEKIWRYEVVYNPGQQEPVKGEFGGGTFRFLFNSRSDASKTQLKMHDFLQAQKTELLEIR